MNVANFLNNGMDQYFVFQNAFNTSKIQVLDLYVYNLVSKQEVLPGNGYQYA